MRIIFSKNDLIGSRWIRELSADRGIEEIPSHVSWLFFDFFVLESAFPFGFRVNTLDYFTDHNDIICAFEIDEKVDEIKLMKKVCSIYYGMKYDVFSVLFQGYSILMNKLFGKRIPLDNKWDSNARVSCQEILKPLLNYNLEMFTPNEIMELLKSSDKFKETVVCIP